MIVAGIDASLTRTAVAIGSSEFEFEVETFESPRSSKAGDHVNGKAAISRARRCESLVAGVDAFLRERSPRVILVEGYSYGSSNNREVLAELGGLLRWHLADYAQFIFEVAPGTLKKFVCGNGAAKKEQMLAHVSRRWGEIYETSDEADAVGLYQLGLRCAGIVEATSTERQSVKKVLGDTVLSL